MSLKLMVRLELHLSPEMMNECCCSQQEADCMAIIITLVS